jgi:hypothetical protein
MPAPNLTGEEKFPIWAFTAKPKPNRLVSRNKLLFIVVVVYNLV